jgi:hypothetical protein
MEGEELLLLVIVHIVEETSLKTFMGKLVSGEMFQN